MLQHGFFQHYIDLARSHASRGRIEKAQMLEPRQLLSRAELLLRVLSDCQDPPSHVEAVCGRLSDARLTISHGQEELARLVQLLQTVCHVEEAVVRLVVGEKPVQETPPELKRIGSRKRQVAEHVHTIQYDVYAAVVCIVLLWRLDV